MAQRLSFQSVQKICGPDVTRQVAIFYLSPDSPPPQVRVAALVPIVGTFVTLSEPLLLAASLVVGNVSLRHGLSLVASSLGALHLPSLAPMTAPQRRQVRTTH